MLNTPISRKSLILLVEDTKFVERAALAQLSDYSDISVHVARNGIEALDQLVRHNYDLILMDVQMPEMDGLTATRLIRDRQCRVPIIGITSIIDTNSCFDAGMNDVIAKPANYKNVITKWLPDSSPRRYA